MYNDYYLEQINNKLGNISTELNDLHVDTNNNFASSFSGDTYIYNSISSFYQTVHFYSFFVNLLLFAIIFYHFYVSCFKGR